MVIMLACGGTNRPPALLHADSSDALPAGSFVCCVLMHMPPAPPNLPSYLHFCRLFHMPGTGRRSNSSTRAGGSRGSGGSA